MLLGVCVISLMATAQNDFVISGFDDDSEVLDVWSATWGTTPFVDWSEEDVDGRDASGSIAVTADYYTASDDGWEQMVVTRSFEEPVVGSQYLAISVDVKVDPSSVPTNDGNYGYFELKRLDGATFGGVNLTSTDWTRVSFELAATEGEIPGIIVQNGNSGFQGPITYHMDNLSFTPRDSGETSAPSLLMEPGDEASGLKLVASAFGQAFQRQNVVYAPSEDWFAGVYWDDNETFQYQVTWADFPDRELYAGFQGHIILTVDGGGAISPDWNDPNVILVEFQYANWIGDDGEEGTEDDTLRARARFLHKIDEPGGNAMLYRTDPANGPVGFLGEVWADQMEGTWTLSFDGLSDAAIATPDGNSVAITLPEDSAFAFDGANSENGIAALFGVQPNSEDRIGQSATISRLSIQKGDDTIVDEAFEGGDLDPDTWILRAQDPGGIFPISSDIIYAISWALPDDGFELRGAASVEGPWLELGPAQLVGARRQVLIREGDLPGEASGFFQLRQSDDE